MDLEELVALSKVTRKSIRVFNYLTAIIPLGMAVFLSVIYILGGWGSVIEGHSLDFYSLETISPSISSVAITFTWFLVVMLAVMAVKRIGSLFKTARVKVLVSSVVIFLIAFGIRMLLLCIYAEDLVPFSDFDAAWQRARGDLVGGHIDYYSLFPAYLNFSAYEHTVIWVSGEKYINVLFLNAFYSGITAFILYDIALEITNNEICALWVGIIYGLYPSNIIYIATGTPEFLAVLFNTIGVFILLKAFKSYRIAKKALLIAIGGAALGIGGSFKTYSIVMIIAFAIITVVALVDENKKKNSSPAVMMFLIVALMIGGYSISSSMILSSTSNLYNMELSPKTATPHYLLIGLNTESEGQISLGSLSRLYSQEYMANGMDYEAAKEYAYGLLENDWKNNKSKIIPNFVKKMIWVWQDDYVPVSLFLHYSGLNPNTSMETAIYEFMVKCGAFFTETIYFIVIFFAFFGTLFYSEKTELNYGYEFIALIVFGYFCMIFLAEGQSRYKCLVMPYITILSGLGIEGAGSFLRCNIKQK